MNKGRNKLIAAFLVENWLKTTLNLELRDGSYEQSGDD